MDVLIRFWSDQSGSIEMRYIDSFFFGRAPGEKIVELLHVTVTVADFFLPNFGITDPSLNTTNLNMMDD
jgi:hypothetical protein